MKALIFFVSFFIPTLINAQPHTGSWNWKQVSNDSITEITHLFFADSAVGYLGGTFTSSAVFSSPIAHWFRTIDGGLTWTPITFDGLGPKTPKDGFNMPKNASTPTHNSIYLSYTPSATNYLLRSLNTGVLWDTTKCDVDLTQYFTMFTEKEGYGVGATSFTPLLYKTADGGHTFPVHVGDSLFSSSLFSSNNGNLFSSSAEFTDKLHGTFIIKDGNINQAKGLTTLVTSNGGVSWKKFHTDFASFIDDSLFGNIQYQKGTPNLWLMPSKEKISNVSDYWRWQGLSKNRLTYCFSSDYGKSWSYDTSFAGKVAAIYGITPSNIWMLLFPKNVKRGAGDFGTVYTIVHSINSGLSWDIDTSSIGYASDLGRSNAQAMYFTDANHGWIAAIHDNRPYVFYYQPSYNSVIDHLNSAKYNSSLFPNPAIDHIRISLPEGVVIMQTEVYDIQGRKYSIPYKMENNAVVLNTQELRTGIWLAVIKHNYGINITRFVLQK